MAKRITKISIYNKQTGWSTPVPIGAQASNTTQGVSKIYGGTGQNNDGSMTQKAITDAINLAQASAKSADNITGTVSIGHGGTGAVNAAGARSNLGITPGNIGAAPASHTHGAGDITSGTLGVARGGTGATSYTTNAVLLGNGSNAIKTSGAVGNSTTPVYINSNGGISTCVGEASADQISAMLSSLGL